MTTLEVAGALARGAPCGVPAAGAASRSIAHLPQFYVIYLMMNVYHHTCAPHLPDSSHATLTDALWAIRPTWHSFGRYRSRPSLGRPSWPRFQLDLPRPRACSLPAPSP